MNKHIYVYSPSSAVRDRSVIRRGVKRLQALGYEVELDETVRPKQWTLRRKDVQNSDISDIAT